MLAAEWFVYLLAAYAAIGVLFGVGFVAAWMHKLDANTREAGVGFRLIVFPAAAVLWPYLFRRLIGRRQ